MTNLNTELCTIKSNRGSQSIEVWHFNGEKIVFIINQWRSMANKIIEQYNFNIYFLYMLRIFLFLEERCGINWASVYFVSWNKDNDSTC